MTLPRNRAGFTLIELLVVTGLILVLATLTVGIVANSMDQDRVRQGADQMQGWLVMAKQWAKRNKVPTGIRLTAETDPVTGYAVITKAAFVEQPDDFTGPSQSSLFISPNPPANVDPKNPLPSVSVGLANSPGNGLNGVVIWAPYWPVQARNNF